MVVFGGDNSGNLHSFTYNKAGSLVASSVGFCTSGCHWNKPTSHLILSPHDYSPIHQITHLLGDFAAPIREVAVSSCRRYGAAACGRNILMVLDVVESEE